MRNRLFPCSLPIVRVLRLMVVGCAVAGAASAQSGAAFLDLGTGARAAGLGSAFGALATGADAVHYNPAGLAAETGRSVQAGLQPMSLDRSLTALSASLNLRGGLAFGLAWTQASAGAIDARTGSGDLVAGGIDDAQRSIAFALGTRVNDRLLVGGSLKLLHHEIDVPGAGASTATGRGVDLGAQYQFRPGWSLAAGARNLGGKLSWTVRRAAAQSGATEDDVASTLYLSIAGSRGPLTFGGDAELFDMRGISQPRAHVGVEAHLSTLLSLRAGLHRIGDAEGFGLPAFGLSVRPMHREALQIHYAWVDDDLGAGGRSVISVEGAF